MAMDVIDYQIFGDDMQYVEVELDPNEAVVGEAGSPAPKVVGGLRDDAPI